MPCSVLTSTHRFSSFQQSLGAGTSASDDFDAPSANGEQKGYGSCVTPAASACCSLESDVANSFEEVIRMMEQQSQDHTESSAANDSMQ